MFFPLLLLIPCALALPPPTRHVVNAIPVEIEDFDFMGSYQTSTGSHTCGVVLISCRHALTAGTCGGGSAFTMSFGSMNRTDEDRQRYNVSSVTRHPNYAVVGEMIQYDLALVEATTDIAVGGGVGRAVLAPTERPADGALLWLTGWGRTCASCAFSEVLLGAQQELRSDDFCIQNRPSNFHPESSMCAINDPADPDAGNAGCSGDQGSAFSLDGVLYGIFSFTSADCSPAKASVYASVGAPRTKDWICDIVDHACVDGWCD